MSAKTNTAECDFVVGNTDSKTAKAVEQFLLIEPTSRWIRKFSEIRGLLRSGVLRQGAIEDSPIEKKDPTKASIFFLHGESHSKRRAAINPLFTVKAVMERYLPVMQEHTKTLLTEFRKSGRGLLDEMALRLVGSVAFEIIGLSQDNLQRTIKRIEKANGAPMAARGGIWILIAKLRSQLNGLLIFYQDVKPAIDERRRVRKDDLISRLLDEGRTDQEIMVECMTFGLAGAGTTKEFLTVSAWHLFDNDDLRQRFLGGDEGEQTHILLEILRLEPVASMLWRNADADIEGLTVAPIPRGTKFSLDLRAANQDESEVGACPHKLDPDRARREGKSGVYMSFGNAEHFCPGQKVAVTETRIFLDQLFRVPGIRLEQKPTINVVPPMLMMYELRNAVIACDPE